MRSSDSTEELSHDLEIREFSTEAVELLLRKDHPEVLLTCIEETGAAEELCNLIEFLTQGLVTVSVENLGNAIPIAGIFLADDMNVYRFAEEDLGLSESKSPESLDRVVKLRQFRPKYCRRISQLVEEDKEVLPMIVGAGETIRSTISRAIERARKYEVQFWQYLDDSIFVEFNFNTVLVRVAVDSDEELIHREWNRAMSGYIDSPVGPYPKEDLSEEELARDKRIEARKKQARKQRAAERKAENLKKKKAIEQELAGTPELQLRDEEGWQEFVEANSADFYSAGVVEYARRWGRLMQKRMADGEELSEIAKETSFEANIDGVTGFVHGCAVQALAKFWKHGEELRRWHNLDTQINTEGEEANKKGSVLNPALLSIES